MPVESNDTTQPRTYDYFCSYEDCGYSSTKWGMKKWATARGEEHEAEHKTGEPMQELADFEKSLEA